MLVFVALALASAFSVAMYAARPFVTTGVAHEWLVWNLFLAWIPFVFALVVYDRVKEGRSGPLLWLASAGWLAFLPNAPYLVTDLIHLPELGTEPILYDATMYVAFAWSGLMLGLVSLYLVHLAMRERFGSLVGWGVAAGATLLTGVGVYLGRYLRWNSWDILAQPIAVLGDLAAIVRDPLGTPAAVTVLFAGFFAVTYLAMYAFAELRAES